MVDILAASRPDQTTSKIDAAVRSSFLRGIYQGSELVAPIDDFITLGGSLPDL